MKYSVILFKKANKSLKNKGHNDMIDEELYDHNILCKESMPQTHCLIHDKD